MEIAVNEAVQILERTPLVLDALLRGLDPTWTRGAEGPDTWSPYEVVGHLIHGEETDWMVRARLILEHGESRTFKPFDRFAFANWVQRESLEDLLDRFRDLREANLRGLAALTLTPERLQLTGVHPEFGRVTMGQLIATWVAHDLSHLGQISRVMAKQYRNTVGPWVAYLPILTR